MSLQIHDNNFIVHRAGGREVAFMITNRPSATDADTTKYYGYLSAEEAWLIMQDDTVTGTSKYLLGFGKADYLAKFAVKETLTYQYFSDLFPKI